MAPTAHPSIVGLTGEEGGRGYENEIICSRKLLTFLSSVTVPSLPPQMSLSPSHSRGHRETIPLTLLQDKYLCL